MKKLSLLGATLLSACVTINIYFPAAAAEKVADEIIKDIQDNRIEKDGLKPKSEFSELQFALLNRLEDALAVIISSAHAEEANLSIDSAEIRQLRAGMEARFASLQPMYSAGYIGVQSDGLLAVRDPGSIPLKDRNAVNKLVAAENEDRQKLYQAIANANGHPDWAAQIKSTFASRWVGNAQPGWWYQSAGGWKQK